MNENTKNQLKDSVSPYLRSAAHQPVDWHEWGAEAFARAQREGKPMLLDIGAVWCHWCHVIDRESYENPEIAEIINRNFVAVKVDRDERPDVDARYQTAVSAISGQGGWPLTAFLTPEGKPFFGGTYFPPEDAMGRPGFKRVLGLVAEAFQERRGDVDKSAQAIEEAIRKADAFVDARAPLSDAILGAMTDSIVRNFDLRHGGFGTAPKFPHAAAVDFLLERYQSTREASLLLVAEKTLEKMGLGGVYDQLGGGFHRYSVDERWIVPHFEKMSYDNSELLRNFLHGWQVTGKLLFREVAEGIIAWVEEVLSDPERGGFYASQDADQTLDDDGDYFTWTLDELRLALPPEEARVMELYYDVEARGEMHHNPAKNVLWVARGAEEIAKQLGLSPEEIQQIIANSKQKMLAARRKREPRPAVDTTLYVGWNAMFVSAFLEAAHALGRADCRAFALKTLDRILAEAWDDARGFAHRIAGPRQEGLPSPRQKRAPGSPARGAREKHQLGGSGKPGRQEGLPGPRLGEPGRLDGTLDDQIFTAVALLDAYEATLEQRYFDAAGNALRVAVEKFADREAGGFFDRAVDAPPPGGLDHRRKPFQDSPTPGTNSIAAIILDRMYGYTGNRVYHDWAEKTLECFAGVAPQYGLFAASFGLAALVHQRHAMQVVVTGGANDPHANALEDAARKIYRFAKAVLRVTPQFPAADNLPPALKETIPNLRADVSQGLVCFGSTCLPPVTDSEELQKTLTAAAHDTVAR